MSGRRDDYRDDLPVSRGQWEAIAKLALNVLLVSQPTSRFEATEVMARLRRTTANSGDSGAGGKGDDPIPF